MPKPHKNSTHFNRLQKILFFLLGEELTSIMDINDMAPLAAAAFEDTCASLLSPAATAIAFIFVSSNPREAPNRSLLDHHTTMKKKKKS